MTYYDILTVPKKSSIVRNFITMNKYGYVSDMAEIAGRGILRADLQDHSVGVILSNKLVISIEKPMRLNRT